MKFPNPKIISFRDEVDEITNTSYLTHSLYYHPAKFIPQIVKYCLTEYTKKGGKTLDPFAGSGTTGLEASVNGYSALLTDINPLLDYFYPIKLPEFSIKEWDKYALNAIGIVDKIYDVDIKKLRIKNTNSKLEYWYPPDLFLYFSKIFEEIKKQKNPIVKKILILTFFKLSKKYSFAEHAMPKLFTSKRKRQTIQDLNRNTDFPSKIAIEAKKEIKRIDKSVTELINKFNLKKIEYYSGVDAYNFNYKEKGMVDSIITSPPYLQAQEYMRTFKLEMMWLGYSDEKIKSFSKKEIPFRKPEGRINGQYINTTRDKIKSKKLQEMFDSYFWFTIKAIENASNSLRKKGNLCVLIGNPVMEKELIEIWKVIYEYFVVEKGYKPIEVFEDKIVTRKLFSGRKNNNPTGMHSEFLLVLEK
ncbi:MAG: DNA methyltransferase [Candidatus Paceibacterota bacterium]